MEQHLPCNEHDCPGEPIGESGEVKLDGRNNAQVVLNVEAASPIVVMGPLVGAGERSPSFVQMGKRKYGASIRSIQRKMVPTENKKKVLLQNPSDPVQQEIEEEEEDDSALRSSFNELVNVHFEGTTIGEFASKTECMKNCYAKADCCGYVFTPTGCLLKSGACAPLTAALNTSSYLKSSDVTGEYEIISGISLDLGAGAQALGGEEETLALCMEKCYLNEECCGFVENEDATCNLFKECMGVTPGLGASFHKKMGGSMKQKWVIEIAAEGPVAEGGSDVPWFTCDTGVYTTNDDPPATFQCGKAEVKGGKDEWTMINFRGIRKPSCRNCIHLGTSRWRLDSGPPTTSDGRWLHGWT
jgi:hypothetical protein